MEPYISEIKLFPWNWAPKYWALCNGALLAIAQNQALFSLIGTTYGGNGITNFALPDLRSRTAIGFGNGYALGGTGGYETITLNVNEMPLHNHMLAAVDANGTVPGPLGHLLSTNSATNNFYGPPSSLQPLNGASIASTGGNQSHENMQPYLVLNYCIAIQGVFPSRN